MKNFLLPFLALLFASTGFGQSRRSSATFGIQGGINIANMKAKSGNYSAMGSGIVGLNIGGFVELPSRSDFNFQAELAFSMAGMKEANNEKLMLSYINIPLLAKYGISNSGLSIFAGPQFGILASAKAKTSGITVDIKSGCKELDISGVFGASFQPQNSRIVLSARYQLGMTNIVENLPDETSISHRIATFMIGYRF